MARNGVVGNEIWDKGVHVEADKTMKCIGREFAVTKIGRAMVNY